MPIYALRCLSCERKWEETATMAGRDQIQCCGERAETDFNAMLAENAMPRDLNRRFAGSQATSFKYKFMPWEVNEKRAMMGDIGHKCITDGGQVVFEDRRTERQFSKTFKTQLYAREESPSQT